MGNYRFKIMYRTEVHEMDKPDEIALLVYKIADQENGKLCKLRVAPRQFEKFYFLDEDSIVVYYWNSFTGAHMEKPAIKKEEDIYRIDQSKCLESVRALPEEDSLSEELKRLISIVNHIDKDLGFAENGYWINEKGFTSGKSKEIMEIFYHKNRFFIGNYRVHYIYISAHWIVDSAWEKIQDTTEGTFWKIDDFNEWITSLDSFDSTVRLAYESRIGELRRLTVRLDHGEIISKGDFITE